MQAINQTKLETLVGQMINDLGAAVNGVLVIIGDKLGLYKALAAVPCTSQQLAERTGTAERYVREWLAAQAASGYINYDATTQEFHLSPEQSAVFAVEESPVLMTGGFYMVESVFASEPQLSEVFRTGKGLSWSEHCNCLFCGTEKFFQPSYRANLVAQWLPALDGVTQKLEHGARVADVGCGHGASTIIMAQAYPHSSFYGFDYHAPSIEHARELADKAGVKNVTFEVASAKAYPGTGYDLVAFFDCLHDMGDPVGAAAHVRTTLDRDGTWLIVEPFAHDTLEQNFNPIGRVAYGFSTTVCVPSSLSQEVGLGLGAQAGETRLREVVTAGGFTHFRRAAETPLNLILEARP